MHLSCRTCVFAGLFAAGESLFPLIMKCEFIATLQSCSSVLLLTDEIAHSKTGHCSAKHSHSPDSHL